VSFSIRLKNRKTLGDYSSGVPPLPIPNREVKPTSADGTAYRGRVGRRQFIKPVYHLIDRLFLWKKFSKVKKSYKGGQE
jgi:hypothetical protein